MERLPKEGKIELLIITEKIQKSKQKETIFLRRLSIGQTSWFMTRVIALDVRCSIAIHCLDVPKFIHERYLFNASVGMFPNFLFFFFFFRGFNG